MIKVMAIADDNIALEQDALEQLRMVLHRTGLSNYEVAYKSRVGYGVVHHLMKGRDISFDSFRSVVDAFGLVVEVRPREDTTATQGGT